MDFNKDGMFAKGIIVLRAHIGLYILPLILLALIGRLTNVLLDAITFGCVAMYELVCIKFVMPLVNFLSRWILEMRRATLLLGYGVKQAGIIQAIFVERVAPTILKELGLGGVNEYGENSLPRFLRLHRSQLQNPNILRLVILVVVGHTLKDFEEKTDELEVAFGCAIEISSWAGLSTAVELQFSLDDSAKSALSISVGTEVDNGHRQYRKFIESCHRAYFIGTLPFVVNQRVRATNAKS